MATGVQGYLEFLMKNLGMVKRPAPTGGVKGEILIDGDYLRTESRLIKV